MSGRSEAERGLGGRTMDEWRIGIYAALMSAYQERSRRYHASTGSGPAQQASRSPLAYRQIERDALKNGCIRLLLNRAAVLTGGCTTANAASPPVALVDEPPAEGTD